MTQDHVPTLYTVGHSNHSLERFLELLESAGIEVVVDVRSVPFSRYAPKFNREGLAAALRLNGIRYLFMGSELGGRPEGDEFYDDDDHVLYGRVAEADFFREGIARVEDGLGRHRVGLMCSEEDPTDCHRRLLVGRVLRDHGVEILHVRGDGRVESDDDLARGGDLQGALFDTQQEEAWRSTRSVSRGSPPKSSSEA